MARTVLDKELQELDAHIIQLGKDVDNAFETVLKALETRDQAQAGMVIEADAIIDSLRMAIEEHTIRLLTLQQPLGGRDLRFLTSTLSIAGDLERAGIQLDAFFGIDCEIKVRVLFRVGAAGQLHLDVFRFALLQCDCGRIAHDRHVLLRRGHDLLRLFAAGRPHRQHGGQTCTSEHANQILHTMFPHFRTSFL